MTRCKECRYYFYSSVPCVSRCLITISDAGTEVFRKVVDELKYRRHKGEIPKVAVIDGYSLPMVCENVPVDCASFEPKKVIYV